MAAQVMVAGEVVARIGPGLCAFVGVAVGDGPPDVAYLAAKLPALRIFAGAGDPGPGEPRLVRSLQDDGGALLLVPQFTVCGDVRHGRRPDFGSAAPAAEGRALLGQLAAALRARGVPLAEGVFGADMRVLAEGDGPVTILLDSRRVF